MFKYITTRKVIVYVCSYQINAGSVELYVISSFQQIKYILSDDMHRPAGIQFRIHNSKLLTIASVPKIAFLTSASESGIVSYANTSM